MPEFTGILEILSLLDKSNCRKCHEKTCLAFAAKVFADKRELKDCPKISPDTASLYQNPPTKRHSIEGDMQKVFESLKSRIPDINLYSREKPTGGHYFSEKLSLSVCGKKTGIDVNGNFSSEIHINPWLGIPLINYILNSKGTEISGEWISFRELENAGERQAAFKRQCIAPLKSLFDADFKKMLDILDIFRTKPLKNSEYDFGGVLYPLPGIPILITYFHQEDELDSNLNIFFDKCVNDNLDVDSTQALVTGMVKMFKRIAARH